MSDTADITQREHRIRQRAHEMWESAGKPPQHDNHFWVEAERQIDKEDAQSTARTT